MDIVYKKMTEIKPYEKNPRKNDDAVQYVAESIKEFGFKVPIIIDKNNVIVAGHTRYKASQKLGLKEVPCIIADDLTDEQVKAFRLADNKIQEFAEWDFDLLDEELIDILDLDMATFGFDFDGENYINQLYEEGYKNENKKQKEFSITFIFPIEKQEELNNFIKQNGKDILTSLIIERIESNA